MILSKKQITRALISMRGCTGWSAPFLFPNHQRQVSRVMAHMDTGSFVKKISITCHCGASSRGVQLEHTDNFQPPCLMLAQCCIDRTTGFCNNRSVGPHRTTGLRIVCLSVTQRNGNMKLFHTCLPHAIFICVNSYEKKADLFESYIYIRSWLYSKTCLKRPLRKKTNIGIQNRLSLNAGQKNCRMLQGEHSAILSTFIKLPSVI